jgi:hypothetical protein
VLPPQGYVWKIDNLREVKGIAAPPYHFPSRFMNGDSLEPQMLAAGAQFELNRYLAEQKLEERKEEDWSGWTSATSGYGIDPDDDGLDPEFCQTCDSCGCPGNSDAIDAFVLQDDGRTFCRECDNLTQQLSPPEPEPVAAEPEKETVPVSPLDHMRAAVKAAMHCFDNVPERWQERRSSGLDNKQLEQVIRQEVGPQTGSTYPLPWCAKGEGELRLWLDVLPPAGGKPALKGAGFVREVRSVLQIPFPKKSAAEEPVIEMLLTSSPITAQLELF